MVKTAYFYGNEKKSLKKMDKGIILSLINALKTLAILRNALFKNVKCFN